MTKLNSINSFFIILLQKCKILTSIYMRGCSSDFLDKKYPVYPMVHVASNLGCQNYDAYDVHLPVLALVDSVLIVLHLMVSLWVVYSYCHFVHIELLLVMRNGRHCVACAYFHLPHLERKSLRISFICPFSIM